MRACTCPPFPHEVEKCCSGELSKKPDLEEDCCGYPPSELGLVPKLPEQQHAEQATAVEAQAATVRAREQAQQKRQQTREQAARAVGAQRKISATWEAAALKEQKEFDSLLRAQPSSVARDRRKQFARLSSSESERLFVAGSNEI